MRALSVNASVQYADREDDGLEQVLVWADSITITGLLTPLALQDVTRLGLRPEEATHSLVTGNGVNARPVDTRVVVEDRVYEIVRVTNLPHRTVLTLRSSSASAAVPP